MPNKKKIVVEDTAGDKGVATSKKLRSKKVAVAPPPAEPIEIVPNVILHLRCSLKDLEDHHENINKILTNPLSYDPSVPPEIMTVDPLSKTQFGLFHLEESVSESKEGMPAYAEGGQVMSGICQKCMNPTTVQAQKEGISDEVQVKIRQLKVEFYKGQVDPSRRSACFWCTYDFDTTPCYIPRQEMSNGSLLVYGHFCSPECSVAFLFKENIDDHTKFERFHFINKWYGSQNSSIRPAPNPYYILDRYMGTLSIQEYRKLASGSGPGLIVVDKPMTRVLPEIHTDNDAVGSAYKVKRPGMK